MSRLKTNTELELGDTITEEIFDLFSLYHITHMGEVARHYFETREIYSISAEKLLMDMLKAEHIARVSKKIDSLVKYAGFKLPAACVEEIIYLKERHLNQALIERLASCDWVEDAEPVIIYGAAGTGKSYLAQALGTSCCRKGKTVKYISLKQLYVDLKCAQSFSSVALTQERAPYLEVDLLIIDDFLSVPIDLQAQSMLLEILAGREDKHATLVVTQVLPEFWADRMADPNIADQITNRLFLSSQSIVEVGGVNMRQHTHAIRQKSKTGTK